MRKKPALDVLANSRRRRRRSRRRRRLAVIALVLLLLAASVWFARWGRWSIKEIEVIGAPPPLAAEISQLAKTILTGNYFLFLPKNNRWWYPRRRLERELLEHFPKIGRLDLIATPGRLGVLVTARQPQLIWCEPAGPACYFADETGLVFAPALRSAYPVLWELISPLPPAPVGQRPLARWEFDRLFSLQERLPRIFAATDLGIWRLARAVAEGDGDYRLTLADPDPRRPPLVVQINLRQELSPVLGRLAAALAAEPLRSHLAPAAASLDYLDLRFEAKIFYKPR